MARGGPRAEEPSGLPSLDDPDVAIYTIGQASQILGLEVGALRRLELSSNESLDRSSGGQRRYSRSQLERLERIKEVMLDGVTATGAARIVELQDQVQALEAQIETSKEETSQATQRFSRRTR